MATNRTDRYLRSIGERLLVERDRLGLSQQEMADLGCVSRPSYRLYEEGRREPALGFMLRLSENGADIVYLLFGDLKRKRKSRAICLSDSTLGALYDQTNTVIETEYGNSLSNRDRRRLFVEMCRLAATSDPDDIDVVAVAHDLASLRA